MLDKPKLSESGLLIVVVAMFESIGLLPNAIAMPHDTQHNTAHSHCKKLPASKGPPGRRKKTGKGKEQYYTYIHN